MKIYWFLFYEFFKIGLFSVGGGYATIPFLYQLIDEYGWYSAKQLSDMIAVSVLTPGPVGINMATFAGFQTAGIFAAIFATVSIILPTYFIVISVSKALKTFQDNFYVKASLDSLKPAGCGLLTVVGLRLLKNNVTDLWSVAILLGLFVLSFKFKKNPLYYFLIAGFVGVFLHHFSLIEI